MSSANKYTSLLAMCGMSLTNIVKNRGPNTEPCGTPLVTIISSDSREKFFITTIIITSTR